MESNKQVSYENSEYDSSLESATPSSFTQASSSYPTAKNRTKLAGFNRKAIVITASAMLFAVLFGVGGLVLSSSHAKKQIDAASANSGTNYTVGTISLGKLGNNQQLQLGEADHLTINGQLRVTNSVVIAPSVQPTKATAGQIYYDQNTNQPYYYNGTQFVSLAPTAVPTHVTSIGGASGVVGIGNGLQLLDGQLGLSANSLAALAAGGVTSFQGKTGAVSLTGGTGISINGTTITNSGVTNLTSNTAQVTITQDGNGGYSLGGNVIGGTGTTGQIALFTGGSTLSGSILSQSGGAVTATGNLNVTGAVTITGTATSGGLISNSLTQTGTGNNVNISAGSDSLIFTAGGRSFTLPISGVASQTICTTAISCTSGGGAAVVLQPGTPQADGGAGSSLAINNTGGGTLLQLQSNGSNVFVVNNNGSLNGLTVAGTSTFNGNVSVTGNNTLAVGTGATTLGGSLSVTGVTNVGSTLSVTGNTTVGGTLNVTGATTLSAVSVSGNGSVTGTLGVGSNLSVGGTLGVTGASNFTGLTTLGGGLTVTNSNISQTGTGSFTTGTGTVSLNGNTSISGTNTFTTGSGIVTLGNLSTGLVQSNASGLLSSGAVDRNNASDFTGALSVPNGGTGATSFTNNGLLYGNGGGIVQATAAGTPGQLLVASALGVPTFTSLGGDATVDSGGLLSITKLQGTTLSIASLAPGQVVQYNGSNFVNGLITNTNLQAGNFTNITGTGALASGSISTGFGAISTTNAISTTAAISGGSVTASGALQGNTLSVSGFAVNATGAITAATGITTSGGYVQTGAATNSFSGNTSFGGTLSVTGNASVGGSQTVSGALNASGLATFGSTVAVQGANLTIGAAGTSGSLILSSSNASRQLALTGLTPTSNGTATIQFPSIAGGSSDQVCLLSLGNCVGSGSSVTSSASSAGYVPVFTSTNNLTNSIIYQTGTSVGINTTVPGAFALNVQGGNANFSGSATVGSGINVTGASSFNGNISVSGANTLSVGTGATTLGGNLSVTGATVLGSTLGVTGATSLTTATVSGTLGVTGATTLSSTLSVSGTATFTGAISQTGAVTFSTGSGAVSLNGDTTIAANKNFTQSGSGSFTTGTGSVSLNGNTNVTGTNTFTVGTGSTTLGGSLSAAGTATLNGGAAVTGTTTINTTGTNSTTIGNSASTVIIDSSALKVTAAGATSGITTLAVSGVISGATSGNTINGLIINSGALSGVTGLTTTGGYSQTGVSANTFSGATTFTGAGTALTVNSNATITGTASIGSLSVAVGGITDAGILTVNGAAASTIAGQLNLTGPVLGLNVSNNATIGGTLAIQGANGLTVGTAGSNTGKLALSNSTNTNLGVLQAAAPSGTGNGTYVLPTIAGGSTDFVCLSVLNNCGGSAATVTTSTDGVTNQLAKFTGAHTIANSSISDDGTTVTVTEVLSAGTISTGTIQSTGALAITPSGTLTVGTTNQITAIQGNSSSTFTVSASGFTTTLGFTAPSGSSKTITLPNETGTVCLQNSASCGFATSGSGVTSITGTAGGSVAAANAVNFNNALTTSSAVTINNASLTTKGIAQFNSSDFTAAAGVIDTVQGITTTSAVQFGSLALGSGDLTLSNTGKVITNNVTGTGSADISFNALTHSVTFVTNGGTNSFVLPTSGGLGQVICTSGISCATGGGQAVVLEPSAIQTASSNRTALLINKASGTGNLLQLQSSGTDDLVIDNSGNTTISKLTTITSLYTNSITPTAALTVGATTQQFTLQGTGSSTIKTNDGGFTTSIGFNIGTGISAPTGAVNYQFQNSSSVTPGTYNVCTTAGNCAGVGGSVTTTGGTPGKLSKFTSAGNIADSIVADNGSGLVTIGGNLNVGVSGSATVTLGVASTTSGNLVFKNSTNGNSITLVPSAPSANTTVTLPNASGTVAVSASGPISLDALTGQISCATCLTSGGAGGTSGISSITGTTIGSVGASGAVTLNNALTTATSITIDNASTTVKGIASFNATNFSAAAGAINTVQDINTTASPTFGNLSLQGTSGLSLGSASNIGQLAFKDGTADGFSAAFSPATLTSNRTITVPNNSGTVAVAASGNAILSPTGVISITNSPTFTTSVTTPALLSSGALSITSGGQLSIGVNNQTLALVGSTSSTIAVTSGSFTTTVGFTAPTANRSISFPDAAGTVCLQLSANCGFALATNVVNSLNGLNGTLSIANASAAAGVITIDNATTASKGIASFNATNFSVAAGNVNTIQDIATTATPTFAGETIGTSGLTVNGATTLNGNTSVTGTNTFSVGTGTASFGGTVSVTGLASLAATTIVGATNINATGTANTAIGNATGTLTLNSAALKVTAAGATSGITTLAVSGAISGATSGNTINGLIISSGALSGITGYAQTSGNFAQGGAGTFDTASGAVSLNGNTTVTGSNTFNVGTGTTTLGGALNVSGTGTFSSQLNAGSSNQFQVNASGNVTSGTINGQNISSTASFTGSVAVQGASGLTLGVSSTTAGKLTFANATSARTVSLTAANPTFAGNVDLTIPSATAATDTICLQTLGNCAGSGGGVTATGYSQNYITKFNGTNNQITVSQLYDNSSFVGVNTTTNLGQLSVVAGGTQGAFYVQGAATGASPVAVIRSGGSSGDFLQLQNSAGTTTLAKFTSAGDLYIAGGQLRTERSGVPSQYTQVYQDNLGGHLATQGFTFNIDAGNIALNAPTTITNNNTSTGLLVQQGPATSVTPALAVRNGASSTSNLLEVQSSTSSVLSGFDSTGNLFLNSGQSLKINGSTSFPASPTEGQIYFRTDLKQLYVYQNGKWTAQGGGSTTYVVSASNSVNKEKADFVGNGTSDDVAINAAIAALPATGGQIVLLDGTYNITATIALNKANISFIGQGASTVLKRMYDDAVLDASGLFSVSKSNTTIQNLKIDGNKTSYTNTNDTAILAAEIIDDINISNDVITNSAGNGIEAQWSIFGATGNKTDWVIDNNEISSNTGAGVVVAAAGVPTGELSGNRIVSNGGVGIGLAFGSTTNNYIASNGGGGLLMRSANVSNNVITGNAGTGVFVGGSGTFNGNTVTSNTGYGIYAAGNNNIYTGNTICSNGNLGMFMQGNNSVISNNYICLNAFGIAWNFGDNNSISNNRFVDNTSTALDLTGTGNSIIANTFTNTANNSGAINIRAGGIKTYLSGNSFTINGTTAISDSGSNTIYANQADANGNLILRGQAGVGVNTTAPTASLQNAGGFLNTVIATPAAPTVTTQGTAGSTSYTYAVTATDGIGETVASATATIATGNATLNATNFNRIVPARVSGAVTYKIYRTASGGTPASTGLVGTLPGGAASFQFDDTGFAGGAAAPATGSTGGGSFAGFLGLGTTAPTSALDINGALTYRGISAPASSAAGTARLYFDNGSNTLQVSQNAGTYYTLCTTSGNCTSGAGSATLQTTYNASVGTTTPEIKLNNATQGALDIQDADTSLGGNLLNIRGSNAAGLGAVLFSVDSTGNATLGAGASLKVTGSASFPASPTEGQIYFRTDNKQLYVYSNGKWTAQAGGAATIIVAASNSVNKEKADYVATGTNDETTINAAITALPATGGSVVLLDGTYNIGSVITANKAGLYLVGQGTNTILKRMFSDATDGVIKISTNNVMNFAQFSIDGNKASFTGNGITTASFGDYVNYTGLNIYNAGLNGLYVGSHVRVSGNTVTGAGTDGILVAVGAANSAISNNTTYNNASRGIEIAGSSSNIIVSNNLSYGNDIGITANANNGTVTGNSLTGNTSYGLAFSAYSGTTASGNTIISNGTGVLLAASNITLTNNKISANSTIGISITTNQSNDIVDSNSIDNNGAEGIVLGTGASYNKIANNIFANNTSGGASSSITLQNSGNISLSNLITGNNITDTAGTGYAISIAGQNVSGTYLSGNTYSGTGATSINDGGTGTIFADQADSNGNMILRGNAGVGINTTNPTASLQNAGGFINGALATPAAPTVTAQGTTGSTSYTYAVTAFDGIGETLVSAGTTVANGNGTLNGSSFNRVVPARVSGAVSYRIYRTASAGVPGSTGLIGTLAGGAASFQFDDTGLAATTAVPTGNSTGSASIATFLGVNNTNPANRLSVNTPSFAESTAQALVYTNGGGNKGLVIEGSSGQSADPLEINNFFGGTLLRVESGGQLNVAGNKIYLTNSSDRDTNYYIQGSSGAATDIVSYFGNRAIATGDAPGLVVKRNVVGSADLLQIQNSSNIVLSKFNVNGQLVLGGVSAGSQIGQLGLTDGTNNGFIGTIQLTGAIGANQTYVLPATGGTLCTVATCTGSAGGSGNGNYIQNGTTLEPNASFNIQSSAVGNITGVFRQLASQTADLQQFQDSTGNTLGRFDASGSYITALAPATPSAISTSTTGGTLAAGTYYYKVTALDAYGNESTPGNEVNVTTTGTTSTVTVTIHFSSNNSVTNYRVYRGTASGSENTYFTVVGTTTPGLVDTGAAGTAGTPPTINSTKNNYLTNSSVSLVGAQASQYGSFAVGNNANASGQNAVALGGGAVAASNSFAAFGNATGGGAVALGGTASGAGAIGIGNSVAGDASGQRSIAIGARASSTAYGAIAIQGSNNGSINPLTNTVVSSLQYGTSTAGGASLYARGGGSYPGTGTVATTSGSAVVTGVSTTFTNDFIVGDRITVGAETYTVTAIASATSLTVSSTYTTTNSGAGYTVLPAIFKLQNAAGTPQLFVSDQGDLGLGTTTPLARQQIVTRSASSIGQIIQGAASQTADLFQLQNSTGTVLSKFDASGNLALGTATQIGTSTLSVLGSSTFQAPNATYDGSTAGAELFATNTFPVTTGWTAISGSGSSATATHTAGGGVTALSPTPALAIVAGNTYRVKYRVSGTTAPSESVRPAIGGVSGSPIYGDRSSEEQVITATTTGNLSFTPTNNWVGTIDFVSVTQITASKSILSVANSDASIALEVRTGGANNQNTYIGLSSGQNATNGGAFYNTALGAYSLQSNTNGRRNTALGAYTLQAETFGYSNTAIGSQAAYSTTTGYENTAVGEVALYKNTTGSQNVAIGEANLYSNTSGSYNVGVGTYSLSGNTTGVGNSAFGHQSLSYNTTGNYNNAVGIGSLYFNTTGSSNNALGSNAISSNRTGTGNTGIGDFALYSNYSGSNNTALGRFAGNQDPIVSAFQTTSNLQNSTTIGYGSQVQASNSLILGGQGANAVNVGIGTSIPLNTFSVSPLDTSAGTASQSTTTVTGVGTSFTAAMIGEQFIFGGGQTGTIIAVASATSLTLSTSQTVANTNYRIHRIGLQVTSAGNVGIGTTTPGAQLQVVSNATGTIGQIIQGTTGQTGDLLQLQTSTGTVLTKFNANGDLSIGGTSSAASATALQVLSTTGTSVLNVDTVNSQTSLTGNTASDAATLGAELFTGANTFAVATGWTAISGTAQTATAAHTAGGGTTAISPATAITVTAGSTYQVTFTTSGATNVTTDYITPSIGGIAGRAIYDNSNQIQLITATGTGNLTFTPSTNWNGTVSAVSVQLVTLATAVLQVKSSSGSVALEVRTGGPASNQNSFIGVGAGQANTTGSRNTASGYKALQSNTTGFQNTASGAYALNSNTTGGANTASGISALLFNTTGFQNTASGYKALQSNTTGSRNTASGTNALLANTTGSNNTASGYAASYQDGDNFKTENTLQSATTLGANAQVQSSNSLILGSIGTSGTTNVGIGTTQALNILSVEAIDYSTGTASQTGTAIVGVGTTWTAAMVGDQITFADTASATYIAETITGFTSATQLTASVSQTIASDNYRLHKPGLQVTSAGNVGIGTTAPAYNLDVQGTSGARVKSTTNTTTAFQVQTSASANVFNIDTTNLQTQINGGTNTYNAAAATLYVGKDTTSGRSINAAGTVNVSGADYAEYIPYTTATKPVAGSIVSYNGSNYVVSDPLTAGIVGNDANSAGKTVLATFLGQVKVRVTGAVNVGDILISNGDGTARAVAPASASVGQLLSKIAIAQAAATGTGVNTVQASVGTTSDSIATALQSQSSTFNDISVLGTASVNNLNVSGMTKLSTLQVMGSADIAGNLGVTGNITVKGSVTIGGDLGVTGNLTVAGLTSVQTLTIGGHIITAGTAPTFAALTAAGTGATVTIDGNDTAGTVTITTGKQTSTTNATGKVTVTGTNPVAGDQVTVTFNKAFGKTPHIILTPNDGKSAPLLVYPTTQSATSFVLSLSNLPAGATSYTFNYFIAE